MVLGPQVFVNLCSFNYVNQAYYGKSSNDELQHMFIMIKELNSNARISSGGVRYTTRQVQAQVNKSSVKFYVLRYVRPLLNITQRQSVLELGNITDFHLTFFRRHRPMVPVVHTRRRPTRFVVRLPCQFSYPRSVDRRANRRCEIRKGWLCRQMDIRE